MAELTILLPYLVVQSATRTFALYGNGAVRILASQEEVIRLVNELEVRTLGIDEAEADTYHGMSLRLFGV